MKEYIIFPMKYVTITQGANGSFTHKGTMAIDTAGKDGGIDDVYAPFTGQIKAIYKGYVVWLQSMEPVLFADGTEDYCTIMFIHDNNTKDLYVGKVIRQGEVFFQEGTAGNATGNHIHIEAARGKYKGWYKNKFGRWMLFNAKHPVETYCLLPHNIVKQSGGYKWVKKPKAYINIKDFIKEQPIKHKVVRGDTLIGLERKYGVPYKKIAADNNIKGPEYKIKAGKTLIIKK